MQLEFAISEYLGWWEHDRPHDEIGMITPIEKETIYDAQRWR